MKIFIDDFNLIRIESDIYIHTIGIEGYQLYWDKNENNNQFFKVNKPLELHIVDHIWVNETKYPLHIGLVTLHKSFDKKYRYDGQLGAIYTKEETLFNVFSPVAKEMYVVVDEIQYEMKYELPIWTTKVKGDLEGKEYHYLVRLVDEFEKVRCPYNIASAVDKDIIIDPTKLYEQKYSYTKLNKYTDAVIYEAHVRDMTINLDVEDKGFFLGMINHSNKLGKSVVEYIKSIGITHIQLLPVFDFYGVDEINKEESYNWGYNPMQYFALEGWLSKNPSDPYSRINEFRMLVDRIHELGMGVNMDVVYNHVYERALFPYDRLVPGYFFRHDRHFKPTHSAFLENDVETTNYMVRKLIIDSLVHFVEFYKIDGFRFDLMGLLDVDTMNILTEKIKKLNPYSMIYGEGWNMDSAVKKNQQSNMNNQNLMANVGHFNDFYRNVFKGDLHTTNLGFSTGAKTLNEKAILGLIGSPNIFSSPIKSINYVECHDNMTLYDTLDFNYKNTKIKHIYQDFANHLIAISQGVPFYHAGQEMYRTKFGVENSYNSPDEINQVLWYHYTSLSKFKKILSLRKKYSIYRESTYLKKGIKAIEIDNYIYYELSNKKYNLAHYIKNDFNKTALPNDGKLIFNSQKVIKENGFIYADKPGVYIIKRK